MSQHMPSHVMFKWKRFGAFRTSESSHYRMLLSDTDVCDSNMRAGMPDVPNAWEGVNMYT